MAEKQKSLKQKYMDEVRPMLKKEFKLDNDMAIPKVEKIVVNMGTGEDLRDKGKAQQLMEDMAAITGQKPAIRPAKISVAGFGIRAGQPVGLKVTLRGDKMYSFLDRLITITLPRLRDFRGVSSKSFDNFGNYTLGITEHTVFPEIDLSNVERPRGLEVSIVTSAVDRKQAYDLLKALGMPFAKEEE